MGVSLSDALVSVIIPVFNGERHLEACLESVLGQTYQHLEVVISDQASEDRSLELIWSFADPRIRVLPQPSRSLDLHGNWARGIESSVGEFVKLVCQDDLLLPDCVSVQMALLQEHPSAVLACGRRRIIDDDDRVLIKDRGLGRLVGTGSRVVDGHTIVRACTRAGANLLGEPVNVLIRRAALPEPLFNPRWVYTIDIEFYLRCLEDSEAVLDSRTLCSFRVSHRQLSAVLAKGQAKELRALFSELRRRYPSDLSYTDVQIGTLRAYLLAVARRLLYFHMRAPAWISRLYRAGGRARG